MHKFKEQMKRILPRLRPHSGDAYPPRLDANYRLPNGSSSAEVTPWSLGEAEVDTRPPPMMYRCDENRVGKCVIPANWAQQLAEIGQSPPEAGLPVPESMNLGSYHLSSSSSSAVGAVVKPPVGIISSSSSSSSSAVAGQS